MDRIKKQKDEGLRPSVLRAEARESLHGKWGAAALVVLVYWLVFVGIAFTRGLSPILYGLLSLLVSGVVATGLCWAMLCVARGEHPSVDRLFAPFSNYLRILGASLLTGILVAIGTVMFLVPGVVLALGLSMLPFIQRDRPELSPVAAMRQSWRMMDGHRWELFLLGLSFLGWLLLGLLSLGVGMLFVVPYANTAAAHFYEKLRAAETVVGTEAGAAHSAA